MFSRLHMNSKRKGYENFDFLYRDVMILYLTQMKISIAWELKRNSTVCVNKSSYYRHFPYALDIYSCKCIYTLYDGLTSIAFGKY